MIQVNFDVKQKISSLLALMFVIVLSLVLSWYSIKTSEEILANMPDSKVMNMSKRVQSEDFQENIEVQNTLNENDIVNKR